MPRKRRRPLKLEWLERRELLAADISLVRYFETWTNSPIGSTDPAGITYHPPTGHLFLSDSEINEMSNYFTGNNIFEINTRGDTVYKRYASKNSEPTGIVYSPFDGYFYVTNDDTKLITRYDSNLNSPLATVDTRQAVSTAQDPEDIAVDPQTGTLYVADGVGGGKQILVYNAQLQYQTRFSIGSHVKDGEGIAFDPVTRNLFVVSGPDLALFEFTTTGTFVKKYDISTFNPRPVAPQGVTFAPTSSTTDDPNAWAVYIVDGMADNHPSGRVFEAILAGSGGSPGGGDPGGGGSGGGGTGGGDPSGITAVTARVVTSSDDAEERSSGSVSTNNSDLELVYDGGNQTVGLRFTKLQIPAGATIVGANIQFYVDETSKEATSLTIRGEAADNPATFTSASRSISNRPRTASSVAWAPAPWTTVKAAGADQRTPDLALIVQELVNRPGWKAGNAMAFVITGSGRRVAESYEGGANYSAQLEIKYQLSPPTGNLPPSVNAGADQSVPFGSTVNLDGTVSDPNGLTGVTTTWSQVSGPGTVSFESSSSVDTRATFSAKGTYVVRLTASDGEFTTADDVTVEVTGTTVTVRVAQRADDAEEAAGGSVDLSSSDLEMLFDNSYQTVGMRFAGITIPRGATIVRAHVQFEVDEVGSGPVNIAIRGEAADNATSFTTASYNISSRPRTTAAVTWNPPDWPTIQVAGADQRTPDLSAVIQEIVNRPGWSSGNALALVLTGTGKRTAESFDGKAAAAPQLFIEYSIGSPMAAPPQAEAVAFSRRVAAHDFAIVLPAEGEGEAVPVEAADAPRREPIPLPGLDGETAADPVGPAESLEEATRQARRSADPTPLDEYFARFADQPLGSSDFA